MCRARLSAASNPVVVSAIAAQLRVVTHWTGRLMEVLGLLLLGLAESVVREAGQPASSPAALAHLYLAPSTATGRSVVYG
jgi:hypothetical protein